jgi:hypothetical protein
VLGNSVAAPLGVDVAANVVAAGGGPSSGVVARNWGAGKGGTNPGGRRGAAGVPGVNCGGPRGGRGGPNILGPAGVRGPGGRKAEGGPLLRAGGPKGGRGGLFSEPTPFMLFLPT